MTLYEQIETTDERIKIDMIVQDVRLLRERLQDSFDGPTLDQMVLAAAVLLAAKDLRDHL